MSDLIERITELEEKEVKLINLKNKVYEELGQFIAAWDSGDPNQLPTNHAAMINHVRRVFSFVL